MSLRALEVPLRTVYCLVNKLLENKSRTWSCWWAKTDIKDGGVNTVKNNIIGQEG